MQEEIERLDHRLRLDLSKPTDDGLREDLSAVLKRGVEMWKRSKGSRGSKETFSIFNWSALLFNIGKHRRNEPDIKWCDAEDLESELNQARTVEKAKKRFQYIVPSRSEVQQADCMKLSRTFAG